MAKQLIGGGLDKPRKLNPYKRITKGVEKAVKVDGVVVLAITDNAGKYTYLTIDGVDYYISADIVAGAEFTTEEIVAKPKAEPKPRKAKKAKEAVAEGGEAGEGGEDGEGSEEVAPVQASGRRRKPAAEEAAAA